MRKIAILFLILIVTTSLVLIPVQAQDEPLVVFGAFATPIEEPWDGVIHQALLDVLEILLEQHLVGCDRLIGIEELPGLGRRFEA